MYRYADLKDELFTDEGQKTFLKIRDAVHKILVIAGAVRMQEVMSAAGVGDSWVTQACVDRLVELGEIREITQTDVMGQHRVFVSTR